jgi:hypothetical protein
LAPPIFFFAFNAFTGFQINLLIILGLSIIGSLLFALAGAAMATFVLGSVMIDDEVKNSFKALGRGTVKLSNAKKKFSPDLFFILLKDKKNKSFARIPRIFWAEDPYIIKQILNRVEKNKL